MLKYNTKARLAALGPPTRFGVRCAAKKVLAGFAGGAGLRARAIPVFLIEPDVTIAAAPRVALRLLLGALAAGAVLLAPSLFYLFRVFKGGTAFAGLSGDHRKTPSEVN